MSYLTEQLVADGHDVTLFASGDSQTAARLIPGSERALRLAGSSFYLPHHVVQLEQVLAAADEFDVIHFHTDLIHFPFAARMATPSLTTCHGRMDMPDFGPCFRQFRRLPFVSISDNQRLPMPWLNWARTVLHGLPRDLYSPGSEPDDYLVFLGRINSEKRVDRAIEIARRAGRRLVIGAKVDPVDQKYFETEVEHLLASPHVEYLGEVDDAEKHHLLCGASALLFPIDWPEPFGMVMIEAMACGTPVIAWHNGSVPEVIEPGVTGSVVSSIDDAVEAVEQIGALDRTRVRQEFETRFSAERMAADYVAVYEAVIQDRGSHVELDTHYDAAWRRADRGSALGTAGA